MEPSKETFCSKSNLDVIIYIKESVLSQMYRIVAIIIIITAVIKRNHNGDILSSIILEC